MRVRCANTLATVLLLLAATGCASTLARRTVIAPEWQEDRDARDARAFMAQFQYERDFRICVGPPDATIAVTVIDPKVKVDTLTINGVSAVRAARADRPTKPYSFGEPLRGTMFVLHGISNHRMMFPYQFWASVLNVAGYRAVLVDLRGHGDSTGQYITYGAEERFDLVQVLDVLQAHEQIVGDVGVLGVSYGGAVAIQWAAVDPRIKAVVSLEPFSSFRRAVHDVAPHVLGPWKVFYPARKVDAIVDRAGILAGFDPDDADPTAAIRQAKQPILLIHGQDDVLLPPENSQTIHAAAPEISKLVILPDVGHVDLWINGFEPIRDLTLDWMDQYLFEPSIGEAVQSAVQP